MRAGRSSEGLPAGIARVCDGLLDFLLLAFAAWTIVYHVCLVLRLGTVWAAVAGAAALVPAGLLAARLGTQEDPPEPEPAAAAAARRWSRGLVALAVVNVAAGLGAAGLFAFGEEPWRRVWVLWLLAAGAAVALTSLRPGRGHAPTSAPAARAGPGWPATALALAWAAGIAVFTLFLVRSAEDDTYYVHLASWIDAHGVFPLDDTIFSDQAFPAIIYPPLSSFEAAAGTLARTTGLAAPDLVYYVVAPLTSALAVLALWRLLRAWRAPLAGVALTVAMVFLLVDAQAHRAYGNTFLGRSWHGKVVLAAVLVPVLLVLLQKYVERPTRGQLVFLAAAGVAGVGLSSTGVFLVPVVALACLATLAPRAPREAALGLAAASAYPLGAGLVTLAVGGRTAETNPYAFPGFLVHYVLDDGFLAFVAVAALLIAPVLLVRPSAARITAVTALLFALLFTSPILRASYDLTGLGRVLWRLAWALPAAALVGALAVGLASRIRPPVLRLVPALLLCAGLVAWGQPVWSAGGISLVSRPAWKRPPDSLAEARWILDQTRPGDVVLAPTVTSQTLAAVSGTVYTVAPRVFYALALDDPDAHPKERVVLQGFAENGPDAPVPRTSEAPEPDEVIDALHLVEVDLACVRDEPEARRILDEAGYAPVGERNAVVCMRPS